MIKTIKVTGTTGDVPVLLIVVVTDIDLFAKVNDIAVHIHKGFLKDGFDGDFYIDADDLDEPILSTGEHSFGDYLSDYGFYLEPYVTQAERFYNMLEHNKATVIMEEFENCMGQSICIVEHPLHGDTSPVIAVCRELRLAGTTEFWDTGDFYEGSDYNPVFVRSTTNGEWEMICEFDILGEI